MTTGGGRAAPQLTADLCARAIIAAARAYGDDPVRACTSPSKQLRRPLSAAAGGVNRATRIAMPRVAAMLRPAYRVPAEPAPTSLLGDRILATLAEGTATCMGLATLLDAKELAVIESMRGLAATGLVVAGEIPPEGRRQQRWRLAQTAEVAA